MRQAIQEGFILDVLANYVTYDTYFKIDKAITDDPELDSARARSAIARFVLLHDSNLTQRTEAIVEHFRQHVAKRIGGKAKAMVVTASRLHALHYKRALDKYCNDHGIGDVRTLAAFSASLNVDGEELTESKVNGFPDSQTPAQFDTDAWQILVVAEKYQTGFDQPKLYAMYVDKTLTGLAAVQTLSRLNRTREGKTGTFVLDFRNSVDLTLSSAATALYESLFSLFAACSPNVQFERIRTAVELTEVMKLSRGVWSHIVLVGHGGQAGTTFLDKPSPATGMELAGMLGCDDACRDVQIISLCCYSGCESPQLAPNVTEVIAPVETFDLRWAVVFVVGYFLKLFGGAAAVENAVLDAATWCGEVNVAVWRNGAPVEPGAG